MKYIKLILILVLLNIGIILSAQATSNTYLEGDPQTSTATAPETITFKIGTTEYTREMPITLEDAKTIIRGMRDMLTYLNTQYVDGDQQIVVDLNNYISDSKELGMNVATLKSESEANGKKLDLLNSRIDTAMAAAASAGQRKFIIGPFVGLGFSKEFDLNYGVIMNIPFEKFLGLYIRVYGYFPFTNISWNGGLETGITFTF